jgi:hypothetical protein
MLTEVREKLMKRRLLRAALVLVVAGSLAMLICSWILGSALLAPAKRPVSL